MAKKKPKYALQSGLRAWQRRLRLLDWTIEAAWVPHCHSHGLNDIDLHLKRSRISISEELATNLYEAEVTLVHELLHIPFEFVKCRKKGLKLMLLEQAIETMAHSFVRLRLGKP